MILTKNQERSKGYRKRMWIGKSRCIESDGTHCCTGKFNMALSLCRVLGVAFNFSKGFLEAVAKVPWPSKVTMVCFLRQESSL